jgi:hypothetical protein
MRGMVGRKLEMFARVRIFSRAHPSPDPGYATVLNRFEGRLNIAEVLAAKQHDGLVSAQKARNRRGELRRVVHFQLLRYLVRVGEVAGKSRTELADRFKLPNGHANNRVFLTSVRSMLAVAESQKEAIVSEGMSPTLLEELGRMLTEFEAASDAARAARLDHIGARADLEEVTAELMETVQMLDGVNRWRFGKDPKLLVEWNAAKHLSGSRVVTARERSDRGSPAGDGGTPPSTGGVSPAA